MVTLQSLGIRTPPAIDDAQAGKELAAFPLATGAPVEADGERSQRPGVERFYTAAPGVGAGAGLFSSGVPPEAVAGAEKIERPGVERFETAQKDLSLLAAGSRKS